MNTNGTDLYIGVISGTSVDAIDCALIQAGASGSRLLATLAGDYPDDLRRRILRLCRGDHVNLKALGETDVEVGKHFAAAINALLVQENLKPQQITGIGSHGQTIFHHPDSLNPFSMQIGDPNTIAEMTGITTVADFRRRDMAAGGQGAPLAPLFHQHFFFSPSRRTAVLNIGGIANLTLLDRSADGSPAGFDTGPGNVLMDGWIEQHQGTTYDHNGSWAARGTVIPGLLSLMLDEPYFQRLPPKSTGRELFNTDWLHAKLQHFTDDSAENETFQQNVQRTLLELTAKTIADALATEYMEGENAPDVLAVCGGGSHNAALMARLQELLPATDVRSSEHFGMPADWVEAATFAWLASATLQRRTQDCRALTGARHPAILGGIYPAG